MRRISLNRRRMMDAPFDGTVELTLFCFEHPQLDAPIRVSTDPTARLSTDPLIYGTRSTWLGADPATDPYLFVDTYVELPGDAKDAPAATRLAFDPQDGEIVQLLRSFTDPPVLHMAFTLAGDPNQIDRDHLGLRVTGVERSAEDGLVSISASRHAVENEAFPTLTYNDRAFPGFRP